MWRSREETEGEAGVDVIGFLKNKTYIFLLIIHNFQITYENGVTKTTKVNIFKSSLILGVSQI